VYSIGNRRQLASAWDMLERRGNDAVSIDMRLLDANTIQHLKERIPVAITWPVNTTEQLERMQLPGVKTSPVPRSRRTGAATFT
jgi:hypothetical protein